MHKTTVRQAMLTMLASVTVISAANAGSVAGNGGATEVTQILNNAQLLQANAQIYQQIQQAIQQTMMLQQQLQNLVQAPQQLWGQAQQDLLQLTQLVGQTSAISYTAANINQQFQQAFPGFAQSAGTTNFGAKYKDLMTKALGGLNTALQNAGLDANQFGTERGAIAQIQAMSGSSPGALQAIQAGNMIASQNIDQLQKLRQLVATQAMAESNYLGMQAQVQADQTDAAQTVLKQGNGTVRGWGQSGFVGF